MIKPDDSFEHHNYNPAHYFAFLLEDAGHEVDWEEIDKAAAFCAERAPVINDRNDR